MSEPKTDAHAIDDHTAWLRLRIAIGGMVLLTCCLIVAVQIIT